MDDLSHLIFRKILPTDITSNIKLGGDFSSLESFLRKYAIKNHQEGLTKTYVLVNCNSQIKGFISLSCSQVELDDEEKDIKIFDNGARFRYYPAVKITRLGVDKKERRKGYGKNLVKWAVYTAAQSISKIIGCRFICLDANLNSIEFYKSLGFVRLSKQDSPDNYVSMFYDLKKSWDAQNNLIDATECMLNLIE